MKDSTLTNNGPFQLSQEVEWTSQAGGSTKTKRGNIVAFIPAGTALRPDSILRKRFRLSNLGFGARRVDTYLIAVPAKSDKAKPVLYRPATKYLKATTTTAPESSTAAA